MIPGRIIEQAVQSVIHKNDNSAYLHFLVMFPDPYFSSLWFPEHNSTTVTNSLVVLGRFIDQVNTECRMQE